MLKKIIFKAINIISVTVIICSVLILISVLLTKSGKAPSIFGYSMFTVMTGSMEPTIPTNSLIVVKETDSSELAVGDVISFYSRDPSLSGSVNTHRIVGIEPDGEQYIFTTKGDANNSNDIYTTLDSDVIGEVVFNSYYLGVAIRLLSNPLIFIPLIVVPLALMIIINLYQTVSLAKKITKEEEEKAVKATLEVIARRKQAINDKQVTNDEQATNDEQQ